MSDLAVEGRTTAEAANTDMVVALLRDGLSGGDHRIIDLVLAEDFRLLPSGSALGGTTSLRSERQVATLALRIDHACFAGWHFEVIATMAEGERIAVHWRSSGLHNGSYLGEVPTGARMSIDGLTLFQFRDGLVAEAFVGTSRQDILHRLGAIGPGFGAAGERLIRQFWRDVIGRRDMAVADRIIAPHFRRNGPDGVRSRDGFKTWLTRWFEGANDPIVTIESMLSLGGLVITRTALQFTHSLRDWPSSITLVDVFRTDGVMIYEHWDMC